MKFLLDTDHISILQTPRGLEYQSLAANIARHAAVDVVVSIVSLHEQAMGANAFLAKARGSRNLVRGYSLFSGLLTTYSRFVVLPFDAAASTRFDQLRGIGVRIGTMDLRIGAIALSRGLIRVTRNHRDFQAIPGLVLETEQSDVDSGSSLLRR